MQLIDDNKLNRWQVPHIRLLGQHDSQTFWRGKKEVSAVITKTRPSPLGGITGPQMNRPGFPKSHSDDRPADVFFDVVSECAERRYVNALDAVEYFVSLHF